MNEIAEPDWKHVHIRIHQKHYFAHTGIRRNNTSGFKGVSWNDRDGNWAARIIVNGKKIHMGYFATPQLAFEAYNAKAKELHKEFYREPNLLHKQLINCVKESK